MTVSIPKIYPASIKITPVSFIKTSRHEQLCSRDNSPNIVKPITIQNPCQ